MQIDLAAHIEKLLFLHDTVVIPDFGAFVATKTPATVDYAGGTANPPSKTLIFNENLKVDDGVLTKDIGKTHGISGEDARRLVQEFVDKTQALLNQREIVTLPAIGRLYKNYVQKIQFLPDTTNFNAESYGLPPLQFSPIIRSREVAEKPAATTPASPTTTSEKHTVGAGNSINAQYNAANRAATPATDPIYVPPTRRSYSGTWIILAVLLLGGVAAAAWWWHARQERERLAADLNSVTEQPERPAAKAPNREQPAPTPDTRPTAAPGKPQTTDLTPEQSAEQKMKAARKQVDKPAPGLRRCILVVATLRDQTNVDRLTHQLETAGYQVYSVRQGGYQIGIQFNYRNLSEVQEKIVALQQLTGEQDIWIKKK